MVNFITLMNNAFYTPQYYNKKIDRKFGRGYRVESDRKKVKLFHYGTQIYGYNKKKEKVVLLGGYSKSDQNTLNKLLGKFPNPKKYYVSRKGGFYIIKRED